MDSCLGQVKVKLIFLTSFFIYFLFYKKNSTECSVSPVCAVSRLSVQCHKTELKAVLHIRRGNRDNLGMIAYSIKIIFC